MTALVDVTAFVHQASESDLETIREAMKIRHKMIGLQRGAAVVIGDVVTLINLSPKALNGLTGTVTEFTGRSHVTVRLDTESTEALRWSRTRFAAIAPDVTEHPLTGIPTSCCLKNEVVE